MSSSFFSRPVRPFGTRAVLILCAVFFLTPFALRGARMAVERMENNIKDWLPSDFPETSDLEWFGAHFVGERFVLATWPGCTELTEEFQLFVQKLRGEVQTDDLASYGGDPDLPPDAAANAAAAERLRARELGDRLGLFATGDYYQNWGGRNERWLLGEKDQWYFVTPDGELFRWSGRPNFSGFALRCAERLLTGTNRADGELLAQFGSPATESEHNAYHADPRKLTARLFKTITTGPDVLEQLSQKGGALWPRGGDIAEVDRPLIAHQQAHRRLTGTLFGPAIRVPDPFDWTSRTFVTLLSPQKRAELPGNWQRTFDEFVDQLVSEQYGGSHAALVEAPRLAQARHWDALFRKLEVESPVHWFTWSIDQFRQKLPEDRLAELPLDWEQTYEQFVRRLDEEYGGREALVQTSPQQQSRHWDELFFRLGVEPPPRQTCVIVTLSEAGKRDPRRVIGRELMGKPLGRLLQIAEEAGVSQAQLKLGGPPVDNVAIDEEGTITLFRLIGWSAVIGIGLSYLCFRSVKITIMVFFVGGVSAVASLSIVWWTGASVDAVLMSMPALVYVLGLSGAIHIINYYREAVETNGLFGAPERALSHGWGPCTLAAGTTALGLLSLYASNLLPIKKFGLYSALGVMATLTLLFTYLPSALQTWPPGYRRKEADVAPTGPKGITGAVEAFWLWVGRGVVRRHAWVVFGSLAVMLVGSLGLFKINTSVQLLKLFDQHAKIIADYRWLETHFGKLVPMELVVRVREDAVLNPGAEPSPQQRAQYNLLERMEVANRIQTVVEEFFGEAGGDIVGQGVSAATFAPDLPSPDSYQERSVFNIALTEEAEKLRDEDYLATDQQDNRELWRVSLRLGALNDVDYGAFVSELKRSVEPVLEAHRVRDQILQALEDQTGGSGFRNTAVLVLGTNPRSLQTNSVPSDPETGTPSVPDADGAPAAPEIAELANSPTRSLLTDANQTRIFADALNDLLRVEGFRGGRQHPSKLAWHDPVVHPPAEISEDDWLRQLELANVVVLVDRAEDYPLEFIREHSRVFVDATDHRFQPGQSLTAEERGDAIDVIYTGVVPVVYKAQRTLLNSLINSIGLAFIMIAAVMMILLRDWWSPLSWNNGLNVSAGLISMIPNTFPVVIIFGAMGYMDVLVDIGTMMTASVAMGVAVDDTIHFLTWFRSGIRDGLNRGEAIIQAYRRVATAMTQTTLIGGLGLAVFAASTFTPTQRFGVMMVTLLAVALVGDLILLPALLAGPLGRLFCPKPQDDPASSDPVSSDSTLPLAGQTDDPGDSNGAGDSNIPTRGDKGRSAQPHISTRSPHLRSDVRH